jgi:Transposase DNA-binding/Transposase Tn5 dimerisation domain
MRKKNQWAEEEFGEVDLGDKRLNERLIQMAQQRGQAPNASIAQSSQDLAGTRAAYRFYDNEKVSMEAILTPHREATMRRIRVHQVVLAVQDTTQIDLTDHPHTEGVGYLQDLEHTGFLLHSTLMVTPTRQPLGLLQEQIWTRDPKDFGKREKRHELPTVEKESQKWLTSLQAVAEAQAELPDTRLVSVGDSEADVYALFQQAEEQRVSFLVRACRDRLIGDEEERHLWRNLENQSVKGYLKVALPRQADRPARTATLSIRIMPVTLLAPIREKKTGLPSVAGWAMVACEETPPAKAERIEWRLITNVPTTDFAQACERIGWYSCRWVVEMFHRVLKSGCRVEERQFDDLENTKRFLALDSVVAWRVLFLTLTGREMPEMSCEALFEAYEWQALYCFLQKTIRPPAQVPSLGQVTRWIAQLGGFSASKKSHPGTTVLWIGLQRLSDISEAWLIFHGEA